MRNNFCRLVEPELKKLDADVPLDLMGMLWSPFHMTERNGYIHVPVESFQEITNFLTDHALHLAAARQQHAAQDSLQQRLAEAEKLLREANEGFKDFMSDAFIRRIDAFLSIPGGANEEKSPAPGLNLPRRKVKTEYSTAEEDAQADAWNAALDAVQELNR